ncbi:GLUG motif-containing protein [Priestia koreensis]|uniref:GLUG motif-containing protein n=1 Tax=Priestia koreensis TaxID=284581 RepID=UPI003D046182
MLGNGTQISPYVIKTSQDLHDVRNNLTAYYELGNDIDMSNWGNWNPISYYDGVNWVQGFSGSFNGKGYKIKNLTINKSPDGLYLGLFGQFHSGTLQNVGIENAQINQSSLGNNRFVGALIGFSYGATVKNCYAIGGTIKAADESGGLIGKVDSVTIENCYTDNNITINSSYYGGGLIGSVDGTSKIINCYSVGRVTYTQGSPWNGISGFVGYVRNNTDVLFSNCFWNRETSIQNDFPKASSPPTLSLNGITGRTTLEMKQQSTYVNWDFANTWFINGNYPLLKVFPLPVQIIRKTIELQSYINKTQTLVGLNQRKSHQLNSKISKIDASDSVLRRSKRMGNVFVSSLETSVQKTSRSVRSGRSSVLGLVSPISTTVERKTRTIRKLLTYIEPIYTANYAIVPIRNDVIIAHAYYMENPSSSTKCENISLLNVIGNPSNMEVIE